jgi:hypothetical protein
VAEAIAKKELYMRPAEIPHLRPIAWPVKPETGYNTKNKRKVCRAPHLGFL